MNLNCPECSAQVNTEDINIQKLVAICNKCGHLFQFDDKLEGSSKTKFIPRPQPKQVTVENQINQLTVEWRWWGKDSVEKVITILVWPMLFYFFLFENLSDFGQSSTIPFLPYIPHIFIGTAVLYSLALQFLNSTTFVIDEFEFKLRHGPLPWLGNRTMSRDDIVQLFTKEVVERKRRRTTSSFHLFAILQNGKDLRLISTGSQPEIAQYIEQELEAFMGIQNKTVVGEYQFPTEAKVSFNGFFDAIRKGSDR